jgi:hypothetical protein
LISNQNNPLTPKALIRLQVICVDAVSEDMSLAYNSRCISAPDVAQPVLFDIAQLHASSQTLTTTHSAACVCKPYSLPAGVLPF